MSNLRKTAESFQKSVLKRNVVARFVEAMEHATPEALKNYLKDHPGADPKNHTVLKGKSGPESGKAQGAISKMDALLSKHLGSPTKPPNSRPNVNDFKKDLKSIDKAGDDLEKLVDKLGDDLSDKDARDLFDAVATFRGMAQKGEELIPEDQARHHDTRTVDAQKFWDDTYDALQDAKKILKRYT